MKNRPIAVLLLISSLFAGKELFACGGCVDSALASSGAEMIKQLYDAEDDALAEAFDLQREKVEQTLEDEKKNFEKLKTSVDYQIDSIVEVESINFFQTVLIHIEKDSNHD